MNIDMMRRGAETPRAAIAADVPGVAADLSAAFADDPVFNWLTREDDRREAARRAFFAFLLRRMVLGAGETLRPEAGGAAAIWMPSEALGSNPLYREVQAFPTVLRLCGWRRLGRLLRLREAMDRHHPMDRPHAYLWFLGVTPQAQGQGVGSRLLKAKIDQLDRARRGAFLETATSRNVAFYRRHGFEVVAEYRPGPLGPTNWAMWRNPARL
jgi:ribosomal protein S18 acetylase RimI-like enzyme